MMEKQKIVNNFEKKTHSTNNWFSDVFRGDQKRT